MTRTTITRLTLTSVLACAALAALPASAQSPEFRSSDLPHTNIHREADTIFASDTVEITLAPAGQPGARVEYKVHMAAGAVLVYALAASGPVVSEFHGESDANKAVMFYLEEPATAQTYGQFIAPATGIHGWYLANNQHEAVTVRLTFSGYYTVTPGLIELRPRPQ